MTQSETETPTEKSIRRIARGTSLVPSQAQLGMEFVEGAEGYAKLRLPYKKENSTVGDALHGGAISSLIDTPGAMAAWTTAELGNPRYFGSTVGINVNYLSGAIGEKIFPEGRGLKRGKETIYPDVRRTNAAGKLLAQATA